MPVLDPWWMARQRRRCILLMLANGFTLRWAARPIRASVVGHSPLRVKLVSISDGHFTGDGSMIHGLRGSFGPSAVLRVDAIEILVVTRARQILDLQQFKAFGIDPQKKHVVALKSMQHFRAAFEPIAGQVIVCDSGALCTPRYNRLPYRNVPRPIFPLDQA
jgi:microcystin degradation protein MlrC